MGKVYASADWHGCEVARKVFDFLQPDDKLYFLGDAIDRGPIGAELMEDLLTDNRVIYLKGNHEQFFIQYMLNIYKTNHVGGENGLWYYQNGGEHTVDAFIDEKKYTEEQIKNLVNIVSELPTVCTYKNKKGNNIILEHSGYTPWEETHRRHDPLWDRNHFDDLYNQKGANTYVIHGHTPVQYLQFYYGYNGRPQMTTEFAELKRAFLYDESMGDWKPSILHYCNGHKIDVDMCTITSNRVALLDLDTFEEFYFDMED